MRFFNDVFNASDFMPRGQCGRWSQPWIGLYIAAQFSVFAAYGTIAGILFQAAYKARTDPIASPLTKSEKHQARMVYGAFILFCGFGHLVDGVVSFQWPAYRLFALYHTLTAAVSWIAVFTTLRLRVKILTGI